jgi:hypothetical protein
VLGICVFLALATLLVFGQTIRHQFINYDDPEYVYANPMVTEGLTWNGVLWAFSHSYSRNWHPLTWISHMLDWQLYGLHPGGHHLTSVLLHGANAILLFLVLREMTRSLWASAFVASVFAIHPLRAESVAWISERKDVLSGLFFMLTLGAYVRYVRHPWSRMRYLTVLLLFACGLMSKAMLTTLPLLLLLLDYWPLERFAEEHAAGGPGRAGGRRFPVALRLIAEKVPLVALSAASSAVTVLAQGNAALPTGQLSLPARIENAVVSYVAYLGQMLYPVGLVIPYPYPGDGLPSWEVMLSLVVLVLLFAGAFLSRRRRPYLLVGWLWYVVMLVPVIGIVQVGAQARADRYTYLPQIGIYLLVAWTGADLCASSRARSRVVGLLATVVVAALMVCAAIQVSHWRDSLSLWSHSVAWSSGNTVAENNLAWLLATNPEASLRDGARAIQLAEEANRRAGGVEPSLMDTLAAAYAEGRRFTAAVEVAERAEKLAAARGDTSMALAIRMRLSLYQAGRPYREVP